jgi:hypothetical protein
MKIIIIILQAILNLVRKRRDLIANRSKIPPEYRDDVIVWYSPKKQRLTNYDVIESYAEDFTYWTINNTSITSAQKKIVIPAGTELKYVIAYRGFNASTDGFDIKYTGNIAITYRYSKEDGTVGTIAIDKSGIYHLPASVRTQKNFGFYCNPQTVTEEATIEQLPTSILKDFSGNGNHAYLYGFYGKLNSGVGIYKVDFSKSQNINAFDNFERFNNKFVAKGRYNGNWSVFGQYIVDGIVKNKVTIKITGVSNLSYKLALQYGYFTKDNKYIKKEMFISKDGIYSYDINNIEIPDENNIAQTMYNRFYFNKEVINDVNLIVEEIPDYPNSLCYAGKQYCKAYGLPIFDDYTIIARRTWFDKDGVFANKGIGNDITNTAFVFENKANNKTVIRTASFGGWNNVNIPNEGISYQTKNKYNNADITYSIGIDKSEEFAIGAYNSDNDGNFEGCHDDIIIFKRSLAINEINDITEAIFNETIIEE